MNYPNGIKKSNITKTNFGNRGMTLEREINLSNEYYLENDIAVIYKKPTPITVNKVDYKNRHDATIIEAHYIVPSTTDYNGLYKGKYIDFEAKETKLKRFPLSNIHSHQLHHLVKIEKHGGIAFIIIRFTSIDETYLIYINDFMNYINSDKIKSIPYEYFKEKGFLIKETYIPRIDYLKIIDLKEN